ncbi:MAG: hypothetical protein HEEMFOPI_00771 [Holosporales bacterium]
MDHKKILKELEELYINLKEKSEYKLAAQILMYIIKSKEYMNRQKDFDIKKLSDEELIFLMNRLEGKNHVG